MKPIWVTVHVEAEVDPVFDSHQLAWSERQFTNATPLYIESFLTNEGWDGDPATFVIRDMTDKEMEDNPEAVAFFNALVKELGEDY